MDAILLLTPAEGAVTAPLQAYAWTGKMTHPRDDWRLSHAPSGTHTFDRSLPRPVQLTWRDAAAPPGTTWRITLSRRMDLGAPDLVATADRPAFDALHLHTGTRYYWQVARADGSAASPVQGFRTHPQSPRWIHAPGVTNLRDLGGWTLPGGKRIRQGLVYRSSELNCHLMIKPAGRRVLEEELGIRTDLDLRGAYEDFAPVLDARRVRWVNVQIRPYGEIVHERHRDGFRQIIELFADRANYPILFHCWGGADRAGTVAYLLRALLGGDREQLALDYELTTMAVWDDRLRTTSGYRTLLATLDAFGNGDSSPRAQVEHYLRGIGVSDETMARIREILIEPYCHDSGSHEIVAP